MQDPILVVKPHAEELWKLTRILVPLGRTVVGAPAVGVAIEHARARTFALAVIALGADSPERGELIASLARSSNDFTPIVLVTNADDHAAQLAAFAGAVHEVLTPPLDPATLVMRAGRLLHLRQRIVKFASENRRLKKSLRETLEHTELTLHAVRDSAAALEYNLRFAEEAVDSDPREVGAALSDAAESARRIARRLDDVLAVDSEAAELMPVLRRFELRGVVAGVIRRSHAEAQARRVQLDCRIGESCRIEADIDFLERLLENLVGNALRNTGAGGRVHVSARLEPSRVVILVSDTGVLVPSAERRRLFARHARGVRRTCEGLGPGPGLFICRRIVEAHRGTIAVEDHQGWANVYAVRLPQRVHAVVPGRTAVVSRDDELAGLS